jgi:hydrogenase expression/formation protein HypC
LRGIIYRIGVKPMCLAIPGKVLALDPGGHLAVVDVMGVRRRVDIDLVKEEGIGEGDWVLIHVGFALSKVSEQEA